MLLSETFTSSWFREKHQVIIYKEIYTRVIRYVIGADTCLGGPFHLSRTQSRKLKEFVSDADPRGGSARSGCLELRARDSAGANIVVDIRHNHIFISSPQTPADVVQAVELQYIPDELLSTPSSSQKTAAIRLILKTHDFWESPDLDCGDYVAELMVSGECLEAALRRIIVEDWTIENERLFREILQIDRRPWLDEDTCKNGIYTQPAPIINSELLKFAAICDQPRYVYLILASWAGPKADDNPPIGSRVFQRETTKHVKLLDYLRANVPTSWCNILIDFEIRMRGWMELMTISDSNVRIYRSRNYPFVAELYEGDKQRTPDQCSVNNMDEKLAAMDIPLSPIDLW